MKYPIRLLRLTLWAVLSICLLLGLSPVFAWDYPESRTGTVVDTLHGTAVPDPYRWLEDTDTDEVQRWTDQQNQLTRATLDSLTVRREVRERLEQLWNYSRVTVPMKRGARYFYKKNDGLQNHSVLYYREGLDGEPQVLIDPNTFSGDGTVAMNWWLPSPEGKYVAYGVSESGSEDAVLHVREVSSGEDLPLVIDRCRYSSVAWEEDEGGFYYSRTPQIGSVPTGDENYYRKVFYHRLGSALEDDRLVWQNSEVKELYPVVFLSDDFNHLVLSLYRGSAEETELYIMDLRAGAGFQPVVTGFEFSNQPALTDSVLFVLTSDNAPNRRVMRVQVDRPSRENWTELIPESADLIESFQIANGRLVLKYLHQAYSVLKVFDLEGRLLTQMELPTLGTLRQVTGRWDDPGLFCMFESFNYPRTVFRYDLDTYTSSVFHRAEVDFQPDDYLAKQVWYKSKDGTDISMFVVHKQGLALDGNNPTLLYGYGGFMASETPFFSTSNLLWLERGGVYALPNLRGGGEYGEAWHRAGMLEQKQNTFDDFIAAAEWLIANGYTSPARLAIEGGSNGGLLVGAVMVQRPELFQVVICGVPLLDMIRYHKFLIARFWIPEFGSADDPDQFQFILPYSPYHNVRPGTAYPATFLTAGEADGRVHPSHARKMTAALQQATSSDRPILVWVERKGGHGQGKPISMQLEAVADEWGFLMWQLGLND